MRLIDREITPVIMRWLDRPEMIVIIGSRQVGKTTLLKMILNQLTTNDKIYIDLEDFNLLEICNAGPSAFVDYLKLQGYSFDKRLYVGIDEIQYLENPSNFLKLLHDHYPSIKLLLTGSSSMQIRQKFKDALTGRKIVFELTAFSFQEFLRLKNRELWEIKQRIGNFDRIFSGPPAVEISSQAGLAASQFETALREYLVFGGYPKPSQEPSRDMKIALINEIHRSYVRKDIKDIAQINDVIGFNNLIKLLAAQTSAQINVSEISSTLRMRIDIVKRYLFLLENTFVIALCQPFFRNKRKEISKMPKVFFQDTGLRNAVMGNFQHFTNRTDIGALLENFIFMELMRRFPVNEQLFYWRTLAKAEVDFVIQTDRGEIVPVEVKAQSLDKPRVSRSFRNFLREYRPQSGVIINLTLNKTEDIAGCKVSFIPAFAI